MKNNNLKAGITIAGSIVVDNNKYINQYPKEGTLTNVIKTSQSFGGLVSNTAINLKLIDPNIEIDVVGVLGSDDYGEKAKTLFKSYNLNTNKLIIKENFKTASVDVYINQKNNTRTFFANLLVNDEFGKEKIVCNTEYLHIGYVLLMPYLDEIVNGEPRLLEILKKFQEEGIKTSIDLVTDEGKRYKEVVIPLLKHVNYLIINEIEASRIVDMEIFDNNDLNINKLKLVAKKLKELGVNDLVVIHSPRVSLIFDGENYEILNSLDLPSNFIISSVGAGDGFCAGVLYGIIKKLPHLEILKIASQVAAGVLNSDTSQSKIQGLENFTKLENKYGRIK